MTKAREIAELGQKLTVDGSGNLEFAGDIELDDNNKVIVGTGNDAQLYHSGTNTFLETDTGDLRLVVNQADKDFRIYSDDGSGGVTEYFRADGSIGQAMLFHYGTKKLNTQSAGVDISGNLNITGGYAQSQGAGTFFTLTDTTNSKNGYINWSNDQFIFYTDGPKEAFRISNSQTVVNDNSYNMDFRVESDALTHALFLDAGSNQLGVGTGSLKTKAVFSGSSGTGSNLGDADTLINQASQGFITIENTDDTLGVEAGAIFRAKQSGAGAWAIYTKQTQDYIGDLMFRTRNGGSSSTEFMRLRNGSRIVEVKDTRGSSAQGPILDLFRESPTPADNDYTGAVNFTAHNDAAETISIADIWTRFHDVSDGAEDGRMTLRTRRAGTLNDRLTFDENGTYFNDQSVNVDFRVESDSNTNMLFVDAGNGRVGINDNTPNNTFTVVGNSDFYKAGNNTGGGTIRIGSNRTNNSVQYGVITAQQYANSTESEGMTLIGATNTSNENYINIGGGVDEQNQATIIRMYAAANTTTRHSGGADLIQYMDSDNIVFNDSSRDTDFRIESDTNANAFILQGSSGYIGLGESNPQSNCHISGSGSQGWLYLNNTSATADHVLYWRRQNSNVAYAGLLSTDQFWINGLDSSKMVIAPKANTELVINESSVDADFRVESDASNHMIFVDAANNRLAFGFDGTPDKSFVFKGSASSASWRLYDDGNNWVAFDPVSSIARTVKFLNSGSGTLNVSVQGSLSKGSGSFKIDHPVASKADTHDLVHSFVEAPQADNIYRGKVDLVAGQATVNIDTVAGMTDGTFALLNREIQCFTSNETGWTAVRGSVSGNILTIEAQDNTCTDTISWLVIGERQDQHMYDTDWTDENGKVIVEPLKS